MITREKIEPVLEAQGIDAIVASTPMHVFYTSGLVTSTTVTPHAEDFEETGFYFDTPASPPKNLSIWTADYGGPYLVIAPNESGQLPNLDVNEAYVYAPDEFDLDKDGADKAVRRAFSNRHPSVYDAFSAAMDELVDGSSRVAVERMSLSPTVTDHIEGTLETDDIVEATKLFHELRLTKTDEEVQRLRRAAEANEAAIMASVDELETGMTEAEFASVFRQKQAEYGATNRHTHIGFGPNSAHGHVVPGDRKLQPGDLVRFEVGCYYVNDSDLDRRIDPRHTFYPGDLARTFAFKQASTHHKQQYEVMHAAMQRLASLITDGADSAEIHNETMSYARNLAKERGVTGLENWSRRMSGHNIGLDCHDHPLLSPSMDDYGDNTLETGMVMNWELGHYVQGVGGLQLEETGLVTKDGVEQFTSSPETLRVID